MSAKELHLNSQTVYHLYLYVILCIVGTHMALEAIKLITNAGEPLIGRLLIIDGLTGESRTLKLRPNPDCPVCQG